VKSIKRYVQLVVVCATVALTAPFLLMGIFSQRTFRAKMAKIYGDVGPKVQRSMDNWRYDLTVSEFMSGQVKRTKR